MSGPAARFAVVGDALLDVSVRHRAALELGGDVPAEVLIGPGGQGANVAVRLARLGVEVTLVAALGPDRAGEMLRAGSSARAWRSRSCRRPRPAPSSS